MDGKVAEENRAEVCKKDANSIIRTCKYNIYIYIYTDMYDPNMSKAFLLLMCFPRPRTVAANALCLFGPLARSIKMCPISVYHIYI